MIADTLKTRESEALDASDLQTITLTLLFDYNNGTPNWTWSGSALINNTITVNKAKAHFTINLDGNSTPGAALSGGITWRHPGVGQVGKPPAIKNVTLQSNSQLTFIDHNPQGNLTWSFQVWVNYNGTPYPSEDPTIINADI